MVATFAIQAVTVGLWFVWCVKNESDQADDAGDTTVSGRIATVLQWLALGLICGAACATAVLGCLFYMGLA
jgi:hypothetical protein